MATPALEVGGFYEGSRRCVIKIIDIAVDNYSPRPLSPLARETMEKHVVLQTCDGALQTRSLRAVHHWARRRLRKAPATWPRN